MKVKVSKVFAKFINETASKNNIKFNAEVIKISRRWFEVYCGVWADFTLDYDWSADKVNVIMITYPARFYAQPQYVCTEALTKEFRRRGVKTVEDLEKMIIDMFEI